MARTKHIWISSTEAFETKAQAMEWLTDFHTKAQNAMERRQEDPSKVSPIVETSDGAYFVWCYMVTYVREAHIIY